VAGTGIEQTRFHSGELGSRFPATQNATHFRLICLGMRCLVAQSPSVFTVVDAAWCAAAAARVLSLAVDGSRSWQNLVGILFEASVGGAMLAVML
jgi:hypothetical protein